MKKIKALLLASVALFSLATSLGLLPVVDDTMGADTVEAAAADYSFYKQTYGYPPSFLSGTYAGYPYRVYRQWVVDQGNNTYYAYYSGYYYY